jgi:penicillin amidase
VQASIYYLFWDHYMLDTFGPWWRQAKVPVRKDPDLAISDTLTPLVEDLQASTLDGAPAPWLVDPVTHKTRATGALMRQALADALHALSRRLGPDPARWQWGRMHKRLFASLSALPALARGPYASGGDPNTPDAAEPGLMATSGPSWRMVVDLGNLSASQAIYPGGQSENPVSPEYADFLPYWLGYRYLPFAWATSAAGTRTVYTP